MYMRRYGYSFYLYLRLSERNKYLAGKTHYPHNYAIAYMCTSMSTMPYDAYTHVCIKHWIFVCSCMHTNTYTCIMYTYNIQKS